MFGLEIWQICSMLLGLGMLIIAMNPFKNPEPDRDEEREKILRTVFGICNRPIVKERSDTHINFVYMDHNSRYIYMDHNFLKDFGIDSIIQGKELVVKIQRGGYNNAIP